MMPIPEIGRVCYVGAGTMGCYNAFVAAAAGYQADLYDVDESTLAQVPARLRDTAGMLVAGGLCPEAAVAPALERISVQADLRQAMAEADLVSESVFERLDLKRDIHQQLDSLCPAGTVITTNSSMFLVSDIEDVLERGDRFAALHSHLGSLLVDIVPGPRTSPEVVDLLVRFVESLSAVPLVLKKEHPGYLLNAMLGPLLAVSLELEITGIVNREEIDRAWMCKRGAPMGPFGMMDLFGLNVVYDRWQDPEGNAHRAWLRPRVLELLQPLVEQGNLGMKTGRGFYQYPVPAYQQPGFLDLDKDHRRAYLPLVVSVIGNAILLAALDVASSPDIDRAWRVGTSQDKGPFQMLEEMGVAAFRRELAAEVGAARFDADKAMTIEAWLADTDPEHSHG